MLLFPSERKGADPRLKRWELSQSSPDSNTKKVAAHPEVSGVLVPGRDGQERAKRSLAESIRAFAAKMSKRSPSSFNGRYDSGV